MSSIGHVVIASHPRPPSPTDDIVDRDADTEPSINGDVPEEEEKIPTDPNHQKTALERLMEVLPDWPSVPEPLKVETNKDEITDSQEKNKEKRKEHVKTSSKRKVTEPAEEPPWHKKTKPAEPSGEPKAPLPPPNVPPPMSPPKGPPLKEPAPHGPAPKTKVTDPGHRSGGINKAVVLARAYNIGDHQECQRSIGAFLDFFQYFFFDFHPKRSMKCVCANHCGVCLCDFKGS